MYPTCTPFGVLGVHIGSLPHFGVHIQSTNESAVLQNVVLQDNNDINNAKELYFTI